MDLSPGAIVVLSIVLFPVAAIGLWCGLTWLLAVLGGWHRLARRFPATAAPDGRRFRFQAGMVGPVSYRKTLTIHVSPAGLHLAVLPFFRVGHPPLFIPWSAVANARASRLPFLRRITFEAGTPPVATLRLPEAVFAARSAAG